MPHHLSFKDCLVLAPHNISVKTALRHRHSAIIQTAAAGNVFQLLIEVALETHGLTCKAKYGTPVRLLAVDILSARYVSEGLPSRWQPTVRLHASALHATYSGFPLQNMAIKQTQTCTAPPLSCRRGTRPDAHDYRIRIVCISCIVFYWRVAS